MTVLGVGYTRSNFVDAVTPSTVAEDLLGTSNTASLTVAATTATHSAAAPRTGVVLVTIGSDATGEAGTDACRLRIGTAAVALSSDHIFPGPQVYRFVILQGQRVSFFSDAQIDVCISMAVGGVV